MRVGRIQVTAVSDGTFVAWPQYFGEQVSADARPDFFAHDGAAWLPIGSFLVHAGDRTVLVDAGLGPEAQSEPDRLLLVGGQLLTGLRAAGVTTAEVTDVVCTHLHTDHVGWLYDAEAAPMFPVATVWLGAADWDHFVEDARGEMAEHIRHGLRQQRGTDRLRLIDAVSAITPGVTARPAPGHTPGSLVIEVASDGERLLLLGDAVTCPIQADEPGWHSFGDVDPALAAQTRISIWAELSRERTRGVGAHFPELRAGRIANSQWAAS